MRKFIFSILILVVVSGCTMTGNYGNFVENTGLNSQQIASDSVTKIAELHPPAKTTLEIQQPATDRFGIALTQGLRDRGFAIVEYQGTAVQNNGLNLNYVLDQLQGTALYRVTIVLGSQSITRPYTVTSSGVVPAGAWVRKE